VRNRTAPHGLLRTCGKKYATVGTIQDLISFCELLFTEPRDVARIVKTAIFYMCWNSSDARSTVYGSTRALPYGTVRYIALSERAFRVKRDVVRSDQVRVDPLSSAAGPLGDGRWSLRSHATDPATIRPNYKYQLSMIS